MNNLYVHVQKNNEIVKTIGTTNVTISNHLKNPITYEDVNRLVSVTSLTANPEFKKVVHKEIPNE